MTRVQVFFLVVAVVTSFGLDRYCKPGCRGRPDAAVLHLLVITGPFLIAYLLTRRVYFSLVAALCAQLVVALVNNAKYRFLREPLVFADFALYAQAVRFPRLYLPYVGVGPALLGAFAIVTTVAGGMLAEAPTGLLSASPLLDRLAALAALAVLIPLITALGRRFDISLDAERDTSGYGLLPTLAIYGVQAGADAPPAPPAVPALPTLEARPNLIAVQSEAFFDARRLDYRIRPDILGHFDRLCDESIACGRLSVPAWCAYTMRSEFAFLSGRPNDSLGFGRFHPLRFFEGRVDASGIRSLPAQLRRRGYRCVCIHPYPAAFYARHRIYPELGFDDFIDIRSFEAVERSGPYVSDEAVCDRILRELDAADRPLFVFAITMENHGPPHVEMIGAEEREGLFTSSTDSEDDTLAIYLRHLRSADRMLGRIGDYLAERDPEAVLAWYGDHLPAMPDIYGARDFRDPRTDYLVWSAASAAPGRLRRRDAGVEELASLMLNATRRNHVRPSREGERHVALPRASTA